MRFSVPKDEIFLIIFGVSFGVVFDAILDHFLESLLASFLESFLDHFCKKKYTFFDYDFINLSLVIKITCKVVHVKLTLL